MDKKNDSVARFLRLSERAVSLMQELAPGIRAKWDEIHDSLGEKRDSIDFAGAGLQIAETIFALRTQLSLAALTAEMDPKRETRQLVLRSQALLNHWLEKLRQLFLLSGFEAESDSLQTRTTYFRRIHGLAHPARTETPRAMPSMSLLQSILSIDPKVLLESQMGMLAMAGFPDRPRTPQQERRKKRRRRRSNPGALSGSLRPARADDQEE